MNRQELYDLMCIDIKKDTSFDVLHEKWFLCFSEVLKLFNKGFNEDSIKALFYEFDMANWKALHLENTEYKTKTKKELLDSFLRECYYISDRLSFDRLFRTHWLFKQVFDKELSKYYWDNVLS